MRRFEAVKSRPMPQEIAVFYRASTSYL